MKKIIIKILNTIRYLLEGFLKETMPRENKFVKQKFVSNMAYQFFIEEEFRKCYEHFKKHFYTAIFLTRTDLRNYCIDESLKIANENSLFLEFGVYKGESINFFASKIKNKKIFGFDSFKGLKDDWYGHREVSGTHNLKGQKPEVLDNFNLIEGWVDKTLPNFLEENKGKYACFVHMDLDTYASTKYVLGKIKPVLSAGCIIVFDNLYNFSGWSVGEYKALQETFKENEYKFICFSQNGKQVAIKIN